MMEIININMGTGEQTVSEMTEEELANIRALIDAEKSKV